MFQRIDRFGAARLPLGAAFAFPGGARGLTEAALAAALAVPTALAAWLILTPAGPYGAPPAQTRGGADMAALTRVDGFFRTGAPSSLASATAANSGDLRLFGLRSAPGGGGSAIIGLADGRQVSVAVGEEIEPGLRLVAVGSDHAVVARGASRTRLNFSEAPAGAAAAPPPPSGTQVIRPAPAANAGATALSGDPMRLLSSGALTPRVVDGRIQGFVIQPAGAQAAAAAGLQPGDVIVTLDGEALNSVSSLPRIAARLSGADSVQLGYERDGAVRTAVFRTSR